MRLMVLVTTLLGLLASVQAWLYGPVIGRPMSVTGAILAGFPNAYYWLLVTPVALRLSRRFPLTRARLARTLPIHLLALTGTLVPYMLLVTVPLWAWYRAQGDPMTLAPFLATAVLSSRIVVGAAIYFGATALHRSLETMRTLDARRAQAARLETELARAQLRALQMQLHPHFLFNTLQAIRTLVDDDPAAARRTVTLLGDLLRLTLTEADSQLVPLRRELEFLNIYLEIERIRLGDRLSVEIDVPKDLLETPVPSFLLQPLVENAIKHGIAPRREPGRVAVQVRRVGGQIEIAVANDGPPLSRTARPGGIGLSTTRTRLGQIYGDAASLELADDPRGGVQATLRIPAPND